MSEKRTVEDYIAGTNPEVQEILERIRLDVSTAIPEATQQVSYQMPCFKLRKIFFYYGAFKKHIGIYPPMNLNKDLVERTKPYRNEKGNLSFPYNQPIPYALILEVALALAEEHGQ